MYSFRVRIAGVVFLFIVNFPETIEYFKDFMCEDSEMETVKVTEENLSAYKKTHPGFTAQMCERAALKYKVDTVLAAYRAFAVHASAISYRGNAYVFTALSGVGKSTHARLWKQSFPDDVVIINDDRPYLKIEEAGVIAYSHPQSGQHNIYSNISCPVKVIGKIVRDSLNFVKRASKSEFFPFLVQQTFTTDQPLAATRIISSIREALDRVCLFEIHCCVSNTAAFEICDALASELPDGQ